MMQDAYLMFNEQRDVYDVTLRHILNMASFLDGPESTQEYRLLNLWYKNIL